MTDRSDELERAHEPPRCGDATERVAVVAKFRPGSRERASQILAAGAPYELGEAGFRRHSIFLAEEAVAASAGAERVPLESRLALARVDA
jgi:hypothetical protein